MPDVDKPMIPFLITATLISVVFIFFMIVFLITFKNKQNRKNKQYLQAVIDEKDRTMYLISMEVHDNFSSMLNIVRQHLNWMEENEAPQIISVAQRAGEIVDTLIVDAANISHTLNTGYLKKNGLISALQEEVVWVDTSKKIKCILKIEGIRKRFSQQTELMLFRVAQEAINNTIKYADANKIEITLTYGTDDFEMAIVDNGVGFDYDAAGFKEGVGINSMYQRTKVIDGILNIITAPDAGTSVILNMPNAHKRD